MTTLLCRDRGAHAKAWRWALIAFATACAPVSMAQQRAIQLTALDGGNGFRADGAYAFEHSGDRVAGAGDINGDGVDDFVIGAQQSHRAGGYAGSAYVVFGRADGTFPAALSLGALNGSNGFRIDGGGENHALGHSVAGAGDVNDDGFDDLIVGAPFALADQSGQVPGASYVVFGHQGAFPAVIGAGAIDGSNGFRIAGPPGTGWSGGAVAGAGDINGDGVDDIVIGADNEGNSGAAYVVFGRAGGFPASIDLAALTGGNGFGMTSTAIGTGGWVAAAGDVNGDGRDDILIGASEANLPGMFGAGSTFVVFGRAASDSFPATLALSGLNGGDGYRLDGAHASHGSGSYVRGAGDIDGDGIDDIAVGAMHANPGGMSDAGSSHVVFGRAAAAPAVLSLAALPAGDGFRIDGAAAFDRSGQAISGVGDVNGDGVDDLVVGAPNADPGGVSGGGASYLLFGRSAMFPAALNLGAVTGADGLRLDGVGGSGGAVAGAGDVNHDGIDDFLIGAQYAQDSIEGSTFVVFGNAAPLRDGAMTVQLPAVLEDAPPSAGTSIRALVADRYLDAEPLAGVAIDATPPSAGGNWQYADDGAPTTALPAGLSPAQALIVGSAATAPHAGQLRFVAAPDFFGDSPALMLRLWDGTGATEASLQIGSAQNIAPFIGSLGGFSADAERVAIVQPVRPVNDAPTFTAVDPAPVRSDAGPVEIAAWASMQPGAANEHDQTAVEFTVGDVANPALFAAGGLPAVAAGGTVGTLRFTPAGSAGSSTFTVRVVDSGGTANGGVDTSGAQTFTITVVQAAPEIFANGFE